MSYWNPFSAIFESKNYPHSRTSRTGFKKKCVDTFFALSGDFTQEHFHVGIFDYAMLMVPLPSLMLTLWCWDNIKRNPLAVVLLIPAGITAGVTNAVRYIGAMLLTVICSPVVALVQLFSKITGDGLKKQANTTKVIINSHIEMSVSQSTLGRYLQQNALHLENTPEEFKVEVTGTHAKVKIEMSRRNQEDVTRTFDLNEPQDKAHFTALLKLNIGGLTTKLEQAGAQFSLFNEPQTEKNNRALAQEINTKLTMVH